MVTADEITQKGIRVYAVLPGAVDPTLLPDTDLGIDGSGLLKPGYLARRIFKTAAGQEASGKLIEVYS